MPEKKNTGFFFFSVFAAIAFGVSVSFAGIEGVKYLGTANFGRDLSAARERLLSFISSAEKTIAGDDSTFLAGFSRGTSYREAKNTASVIEREDIVLGIPSRIYIPAIDVDAQIESLGSASPGTMDVPKDHTNAGWWNISPRPGERGNAIIDGHYGWRDNLPAVFDDLNKLSKGDEIYIEDENGITSAFRVREVRVYGENEYPSGVYKSDDGESHLSLITCGGVWDSIEKSYSNRLVVFADKI